MTFKFTCFLILCPILVLGQDKAITPKFITSDITQFWESFDQIDELGNKSFQSYLDEGTTGLKSFIPKRIINSDTLYRVVVDNYDFYLQNKILPQELKSVNEEIQFIYNRFSKLFPSAKVPTLYYVIGALSSDGAATKEGIIIALESFSETTSIPPLAAHELIHFNQSDNHESTLLFQTLKEGAASFLGFLISGIHLQPSTFKYGDLHKERLMPEFVSLMKGSNYTDWLYSISRKDDRPYDLGYWLGFEICKAYYDQSTDKQVAIAEILDIKNAEEFLEKSGFLEKEN